MSATLAPRAAKPLGYRPQLDGLRAFAVAAVLYTHFWRDSAAGDYGVRLFFVLSGFLITSILLIQKEAPGRIGGKLRTFFARRILRLWPAYYAVLAIAWASNLGNIAPSIGWHLAQLSNVYFLLRGEWEPWVAAHLWTLSVEEQFYLVWSFATLLLPLRALRLLAAAIAGAGVLARAAGPLLAADQAWLLEEVTAPFEALAVGAILALVLQAGVSLERLRAWLAPAALAAAVLLAAGAVFEVASLGAALQTTLVTVIFAWLVIGAATGFGGWAGAALGQRAIVHLGRVSYGIYLFHLFVAAALFDALHRLAGITLDAQGPLTFVVMSSATVLAALLSWRFFERPINGLKRRFPYPALSMEERGLDPADRRIFAG